MKSIKDLRIEIDTIINTLLSKVAIVPSREVSLSLTNAQRAKMWLGKVLEAAGRENPYPEGKNPGSTVIEPQAEHTEATLAFAPDTDQTARVKYLRKAMDSIIDEFNEEGSVLLDENVPMHRFKDEAYMAMIESQMWLGVELNRILNSKK